MKLTRFNIFICVVFFTLNFFSQENRSSKNFKLLHSILEKNTEADSNNDGTLTEVEYRVYQSKDVAQRKVQGTLKGYYNYIKDVSYSDHEQQSLDVIIPENRTSKKLPVIVFIHGGGWKNGNKNAGLPMLDPFLKSGEYIGVSINYRLSGVAKWPSQIQDCNAAIRFIKANAKKYGIDKNKICVWGTSAGGHLSAMLAVSQNNKEFKGTVGNYLNTSSEITCAIDGFGPTDFLMKETVSIIPKLIANKIEKVKKVSYNIYNLLEGIEKQARDASPYYYAHKNAKPLFIYHGLADPLVNIKHSEKMQQNLLDKGNNDVYFNKVEGLKHEPIICKGLKENIQKFLDKYLKYKKVTLNEVAIIPANK